MKKTLSLLILSATLFTACKKDRSPKATKPTVLVTRIIEKTTIMPGYGLPVAEFTYNGKQLTQAVTYAYASPATPANTYTATTYFNYNSQGQLTGTTIEHSNSNTYDDVKSVVNYSGNNISSITFYLANNVVDRTVSLTYQNGLLTQYFDPTQVKDVYTYDSNGNNTRQQYTEYYNGAPDGNEGTLTNSTFDTSSNFQQAFPMWIYFRSFDNEPSLTMIPGKNNPLSTNDEGTAYTFNYQYNSYGYPAMITAPGQYAYAYEYTQVN